ncbi:hypothetical protein DV495_004406 [Geotrichum candidum]|nr:hypothetical protein DV495_004406 [Geotrichum candidum]KAF7497455.1 hypothetical protein DV113_004521 [Geotrichum candidum]
MVLDRLVKLVQWRYDEVANVEEFYQSAVGTIDSFGKESCISPYDNRIFTSTGKLLVEISKGWPKELEYGWINRRVVTIFDAVGVMQDQPDILNVVFVFTDSVVVIKPQEPISVTSDSGIHKPSVADMLMHSMINSVPLPNMPELNVVGWAPIENVYMAEVEGAQSLAMYITGAGFVKSDTDSSNLELFRLISPDVTASSIINFLSKAKIMNKTQPFHLFLNQQQHFSIFATVQEYQGYVNEVKKCPIAIFANMHIPDNTLDAHGLVACIGTQIFDTEHVSITVMSKLAYNIHKIVLKTEFSAAIASQVSHLYIKESERVSDTSSGHNTSRSSLLPAVVTGQRTATNSVVSVAGWSTDKADKENTTHIEDLTAISLDTTRSFITVSDMTSLGADATSDKGYSDNGSNDSVQKSSDHSISVKEWYQDLVANNRSSLDSSLDSVPGIDAIESTFEDEDEDEAAEGADVLTDLTESMRNLTEFISEKHSPHSRSEDSVLLADDFSYLAGMVSSTEQNDISRTGSLYPDMRESSVLFLGNYAHGHDDAAPKHSSIESLGAFASVQQHQQVSMTRSHESHDTSVERIMETRRYKPGQSYSGAQSSGKTGVVIISDDEDLSVYHDCDDDSSSGIDSILRVNQQLAKHNAERTTPKTPSPAQQVLGQATPQLSVTELKLRALTVNLEGLAHGAGALASELNRVSAVTLHLYKGTRGLMALPASVPKLTPSDQQRVANVERGNRTLLMAGLWTLVAATAGSPGKESRTMIQAYLDIEWDRRTILHEKMGPAIPPQLWQV